MSNPVEDTLEDKAIPEVDFKGGKLSLDEDASPFFTPNDPNDRNVMNVDIPTLRRANSICGRIETTPLPDTIRDCFFAGKRGRLEEAVNDCKQKLLDENDGKVDGVWLLTEVDHWDNEKEKLIMITEKTLIVIKYDFVVERVKEHKKVSLSTINFIQSGVFEYPEKTLVTPRDGLGIKLSWSQGQEPGLVQIWNPWSKTIPWLVFTSHPLQHSSKDSKTFQVEVFKTAIIEAVNRVNGNSSLNVREMPLRFTVHLGLSSAVFNQSRIGFSRERGGVSF